MAEYDDIMKKVQEELVQQLNDWADQTCEAIKDSIVPAPGPSMPGNPPHSHTGRLKTSISVDKNSNNETATVTFQVTAPYARYLDEGTERMEARPFFLNRIQAEMAKLFKEQ